MSDLKIASYNVNGIRAATKKGLVSWIKECSPDLICFQEMRSTQEDMPKDLAELDYYQYHEIAQKKGIQGFQYLALHQPMLYKMVSELIGLIMKAGY